MTKTKTYTVQPINTVEGIKKHLDWVYSWITAEHCPLKPSTGEQEVELINLGGYYSTEDAIKKMDDMGYIPAPSPCLLGLGVQHPDIIKEKKWIVSLDEQNLLPNEFGDLCFLYLRWHDRHYLDLALRAGKWTGRWWFAVVRKSLNTDSPKSLESLTLNRAIEICKAAGLKVIEEK